MSDSHSIKTPTRTRRMTDAEFVAALNLKFRNMSLTEILQVLLDGLTEKPPKRDEPTERSEPDPKRSPLTLVPRTK
jgi:hypothetical protein